MENTPFPTKNVINFCHMTPVSLKNGHAPPKLFFTVILKNIDFFFFEKINEKYSESHFLQKRLYDFFVTRCPLLLKLEMSSNIWVFTVFSENTALFEKHI